jgi:hypothetical protein
MKRRRRFELIQLAIEQMMRKCNINLDQREVEVDVSVCKAGLLRAGS